MATQSRLTRPPRTADEREPRVSYGYALAAAWSWRTLVIAGALYLVARLVGYFSELFIPLLVAVLLAGLLSPLVDFLARHGWPRVAATLLTVLGAIVIVLGLLTLVVTQIASGFADLSTQASEGLGQVQDWLRTGPLNVSSADINGYVDQVRTAASDNSSELLGTAATVGGTAGHVLVGLFLAFFLTIFTLYDGRGIWEWLVRLLPRQAERPLDEAVRRGWVTLVHYVRATIIVALTDAIGIALGAYLLGIPLAVPLGVLVFLAAFIPIVGALISGTVAVLVGLVAQGWVVALIMLGVVILVQQLESHVLQPFLLGKAVSVHPVAVILAIAAGSTLAGIPGALFAVPFVAVLNTVVNYLAHGDRGTEELPEGAAEAPLAPDPVGDAGDHTEPAELAARPGGASALSTEPSGPSGSSAASGSRQEQASRR